MKTIFDYDLTSCHKIFLRVDLNVSVDDTGNIRDFSRINAILPTMEMLKEKQVFIASHFGRPKGEVDARFSLRFLAPVLSKLLKQEVVFAETLAKVAEINAPVVLLENLRFDPREELNDATLAKEYAKICDLAIQDAFSICHRAHSSVVGIADFVPNIAGCSLTRELEILERTLENPKKPIMAIVAGSKISTKLGVLENLLPKVDYLVVAGAMANTLLVAKGINVGTSLYEAEMLDIAKNLLQNPKIIFPIDATVTVDNETVHGVISVEQIPANAKIWDIGPLSINLIKDLLQNCQTVLWNGPVGLFEKPEFAKGSVEIAQAIVNNPNLLSIAGGGDTLAAIAFAGCKQGFSHLCTAGGAFLEWLEGKELPGITACK